MTKQEILNHFNNGDVVECLYWAKTSVFNEKNLIIYNDCWVLKFENEPTYTYIEENGQLATIIQPDKTEVYAQLGKEVEVILKANPNDSDAGSKIRKLYGL